MPVLQVYFPAGSLVDERKAGAVFTASFFGIMWCGQCSNARRHLLGDTQMINPYSTPAILILSTC